MDSLVPVFVCAIIVITFGVLLLSIARFISLKVSRPKPLTKAKSLPYECGLEGEEKTDSRVPIQFYLTAILFILFDIEIIFLYPWALSFNDFIEDGKAVPVLLAMILFLAIFIYGLFWEIKSNALKWK